MKSLEELKAIRDRVRANITVREGQTDKTRVLVGMATCGIAAGARPILNEFVNEVGRRGLQDVIVGQTGCIGICQLEPVVEVIAPDGEKTTYVKMSPEKVAQIVTEHLVNGRPVREYTIGAYRK